jgi:hypothetical protein
VPSARNDGCDADEGEEELLESDEDEPAQIEEHEEDSLVPPSSSASALGTDSESSRSSDAHPISMFDDLPELTSAHEGLGLAKVSLEQLLEGWRSGPGRDVDGIVDRLEKAIELVSEAHAIVDLELIPQEHCQGCAGEDCDTCGGFGWFSKADLQANAE